MVYKTSLKKIYGIVPQEMCLLNELYSGYKQVLDAEGYQEIKSPLVYSRKNYLKAIKIHPNNIMYAVDYRGDSKFVIQSDCIMGICEIVSNLNEKHLLKLYQFGEMIRNNVKASSDYMRKDFFQLVSGVWGSKSWYYDAELIISNLQSLRKNKQVKPRYIMLANLKVFDCIETGLSEKIRFNGIQFIDNRSLDFEVLKENFKNYISYEKYVEIIEKIADPTIRDEMYKLIKVTEYLKMLGCNMPIVYSLKNFHGTGYYTDVTYHIYGEINGEKNILLADGGRIDQMMNVLSNGKDIPACCMGIGAVNLLQYFKPEKISERIIILSDEQNVSIALKMKECLISNLKNIPVSVLCLERRKWQMIFKDFHYMNDIFLLLNDNSVYEIRNVTEEKAKEIEEALIAFNLMNID